MTPYELADWLDKTTDSDDWGELAKYYKWCKENVSPMLRHQADYIKHLEEGLKSALALNKAQAGRSTNHDS
jgi:hypothetical protein